MIRILKESTIQEGVWHKLIFTPTPDFVNKDLTNNLCDSLNEAGITYRSAKKQAGNYSVEVECSDSNELHRARVAIEGCGFFKGWVKKLPGGVTESIEDEEYDAPVDWRELNGTEQMAAEAALDDIKYSGMSIEDAVSHACHTFNDANAESEYDDEDFYGEEADYEAVLSYVKSKIGGR